MSGAKCLVSLMVVLVAGVCAVHAQDRIKLCGRELIRLAVASCGNSRLRRSTLELEPHQEDQGVAAEEHQATSEMLSAPSQSDGERDGVSLYPLSARVRRTAGKMSDICCERGCSVRELIQFC